MTLVTKQINLAEENAKEVVVGLLSEQAITIKFTKVDGTVREMKATLSPKFVTMPVTESTEPKRKTNPDVRTVYDIDSGSWKSFRWDKLISITYEDEVK